MDRRVTAFIDEDSYPIRENATASDLMRIGRMRELRLALAVTEAAVKDQAINGKPVYNINRKRQRLREQLEAVEVSLKAEGVLIS